jgi:hypothetical protein
MAVALLRAESMDDEHPVSRVDVSVSTLKQLARLIYRVSQGEDAQKVFRQGKKYQSKLENANKRKDMADRYFEPQVLHDMKEEEAAKLIEIEYGLKWRSVAKTLRPYRDNALVKLADRDRHAALLAEFDVIPISTPKSRKVRERRPPVQESSAALVERFKRRTESYAKRGNDHPKGRKEINRKFPT